ncbi:hypothetical protein LSAT2_002649 [Lamellibrachia satsuma]|nr:hypothetical protein LSAT2_002649 [Lamellibrachia satsuma]
MVTDHQVALSWSSPHTPNGVIQKYEVIARDNGADLWHETVRSRNFTCEVHGGITYSFTVVAINRIGRSSEATPISISIPVRGNPSDGFRQVALPVGPQRLDKGEEGDRGPKGAPWTPRSTRPSGAEGQAWSGTARNLRAPWTAWCQRTTGTTRS